MSGIKHDDGKPLAFTVLSKFWPVLWPHIEGRTLADEFDAFMRGGIKVPLDDPDYWSDIVAVGTFGVCKYGADNWQCVDVQRYREAGARHMLAMLSEGTDAVDNDSGLPHWAHFRWNALAVATLGSSTVTVRHPPRRVDPIDLESNI